MEDLLGAVKENSTEENIALIEHCGKCCAVHRGDMEGMKQLKEAAKDCKTISDYVNFLNGVLPFEVEEISDGIVMHFAKEECTCELSSQLTRNSDALCYCTQGHEKAIWSEFFGKPVDVELVETILRGGSDCVIKLMLENSLDKLIKVLVNIINHEFN